MAIDHQVRTAHVKEQNIWAWLGLVIITLGIYQLFWYYRVNREMKDIGTAFGDTELGASSPGMSVVAMFIPIVNLVSLHNTGKRIRQVQQLTGRPVEYSLGLHWALAIFTGLWPLYAQHNLNNVWTTAAATTAPAADGVRSPVSV